MKCQKCGAEFDGNFCPSCGTAAEFKSETGEAVPKTAASAPGESVPKKKGGCLKGGVIGLLIVVILLILIVSCGKDDAKPAVPAQTPATADASKEAEAPASPESKPAEENPAADVPVSEPVNLDLNSGYYTAGVDIPAGKYDITAVSGTGNVSSDNMYDGGINAMMGIDAEEMFEKEYKNIKLADGVKLSISGGVVVHIACEKPTGGLSARVQPNTEKVPLGNGNFSAGEDFPAGIYDIIAVSGTGNVSSDNMYDGGINAMMGVDAEEMFEKEYKNVDLATGVTLTIDGVSVELVPSK